MEKTLFVSEKPFANAYQYVGYAMSIAEQHPDFNNWILNNYIQLTFDYCNVVKEGIVIDFLGGTIFDSVELLYYEDCDKIKILNENTDDAIIHFIEQSIKNDKYICTMLNEFYVPNRSSYRKEDFEHDVLIYGCSTEKKRINIIGYNEKKEYKVSSISYDEFCEAFRTSNSMLKRIGVNWSRYYFDINVLENSLFDYLFGVNCMEKLDNYIDTEKGDLSFFLGKFSLHKRIAWGLDIYPAIIEYVLWKKELLSTLDIRIFYILYEHKRCMRKRLSLLEKKITFNINYSIKAYEYLEEEAKIILYRSMKYNISSTAKGSALDMIIKKVKNIRKVERNCLSELLYKLIRYEEWIV